MHNVTGVWFPAPRASPAPDSYTGTRKYITIMLIAILILFKFVYYCQYPHPQKNISQENKSNEFNKIKIK
jgi:hypothetical protein